MEAPRITSVLLLAGRSERFRAAGYPCHKALLPMRDGRPMLAHVADALPAGRLITVARYADKDALLGPLLQVGTQPKFTVHYPLWLHYDTHGPLESAWVAEHHYKFNSNELLFVYCDVLYARPLYADALPQWRNSGAPSGALAQWSDEERFEYWDGERVVPASGVRGLALSGALWWREARMFVNAVHQGNWSEEAGLSQVLNRDTCVLTMRPGYIRDVGVPDAYRAYLNGHAR